MEVRDKDRNAICALAIDFRGLASETETAAGGVALTSWIKRLFSLLHLFSLRIYSFSFCNKVSDSG
jgi:hypothetical protein